ncbi:MAG: PfaD family polyunsaturated fatty acid/polyketide biosynthesis protein [Leptospirales bacterium]|jgi:trans-AT polyketide synthase/acyltransferase/oxidoreductase domain-containing protein
MQSTPTTESTPRYLKVQGSAPAFAGSEILQYIPLIRRPVHIIHDNAERRIGLALDGTIADGAFSRNGNGAALPGATARPGPTAGEYQLLATLPPLYPEWLGDRSFQEAHNLRFPYVAGAMARGICTTTIVIEMARGGMLGFFGAAGLSLPRIETAIDELQTALDPAGLSYGSNLIHSPNESGLEDAIVDLYLRRGVRRVSASAYMNLTPAIVRYAAAGLHRDGTGRVVRLNHVFAKISRPEVAEHFLSPPPAEILSGLVSQAKLSAEEAQLASQLPVAEDFTCEADSGGHTDNRPLTVLLPMIMQLRDRLSAKYNYARSIRIGAAGGLGTPAAVAAAFGLGAAYVVTGSVNQAATESGLSPEGRVMLAGAGMADVVMAPSADMFEMGVKVQVLRKGTMFGVRAQQLYDLYSSHASLEEIPAATRARLEKEIFQKSIDAVWNETRAFFQERDPSELKRAERDSRHRMALVFRWYLGGSSRWPIDGVPERRLDYQIWCGPAMGAFNAWTAGSFLEDPANRGVTQIALNLLEGAAVITRAQQLRSYGLPVPGRAFQFQPRPLQ